MIDQLFVTLLLATLRKWSSRYTVSSSIDGLLATLSSGQISTAVRSLNWNLNETWSEDLLPGTNATVIIPRNVTVSLNDVSTFNVNLLSIQVSGYLKIGSPSIRIFGEFDDLFGRDSRRFDFQSCLISSPNSIISIYPNASFHSTQSTQIVSIVTRQNTALHLNINGPFTLTIDLQGRMETYAGRCCLWSRSMISMWVCFQQSPFFLISRVISVRISLGSMGWRRRSIAVRHSKVDVRWSFLVITVLFDITITRCAHLWLVQDFFVGNVFFSLSDDISYLQWRNIRKNNDGRFSILHQYIDHYLSKRKICRSTVE